MTEQGRKLTLERSELSLDEFNDGAGGVSVSRSDLRHGHVHHSRTRPRSRSWDLSEILSLQARQAG